MKIAVIGGGPGGLYFSILTKKRLPHCQIDVYEQNRADDAFGFGVVFSDETLSEFLSRDPQSYERIRQHFAYWDNLDVARDGEVVRIRGNGFCGCSRKILLQLLQQRCQEEGIHLHYQTRVDDIEATSKSHDVVVAADGINSAIRTRYQDHFGTQIDLRPNRFVWLGSTRPLDAFTYFFKNTPYGAFCAHTYQYEAGKSTWIFECSDQTFQRAGFEVTEEARTVQLLERLYAEELKGHPLLSNKSHWRQFPVVTNQHWHYRNIFLLGDAKATAHYSIGSGTKLAMECAIALSDAVLAHPTDVKAIAQAYWDARFDTVSKIQHAAAVSMQWFEGIDRRIGQNFDQFSFSVMSRSKKITLENQALRDADYAQHLVKSFNQRLGTPDLSTPPAFTPFRLRGLTLPNRMVMSPMGQYSAHQGQVNDWHLVHYGARATGGVGLILAEMTAVSPTGRITPGCPGLWNQNQTRAWQRIVQFVHQHSAAKIGIQLGHSGRKGACEVLWKGKDKPLTEGAWTLVAPSALAYTSAFAMPKALTIAEMERIKAQFVAATQRADQAGFDWVELQAHHGFLLGSFLSPLTNQRTDAFGGTLEKRLAFPIAVFQAMRAVFPEHKPMSVRISATDWALGGNTETDGIAIAQAFKAAGADIINVSTGDTVSTQQPLRGRMWQTPFADAVRTQAAVPTITTGYIQDIDQINTLLLNGRADLVALGRPLLIDPAFVRHAAAHEQYTPSDVPNQYKPGLSHLYPLAQQQRTEYTAMKIALKPVSHQKMD